MSMEVREPAIAQASGSPGRLDVAVYAASAISIAAAAIHLWATPGHFVEWWAYGVFFLVIALAQGFFGVTLLRWPNQMVALAGIWGNLPIVLLYLLSRTSGMPVGPHAGVAEGVRVLDMAATVSEVALVVLLVSLLGGAYRRFTVNALLLLGLAIWLLRFTGIAF